MQVSGVGQVQEGPADHQVAHHSGHVWSGANTVHRNEAALSSAPSLPLTAEAVKSLLLTFGNDAVHKSHGEAEEDEVVQMVHLCDEHTLSVKTGVPLKVHSHSASPTVTHQFLERGVDGQLLPSVAVVEGDFLTGGTNKR